jgi:hypothetical protein
MSNFDEEEKVLPVKQVQIKSVFSKNLPSPTVALREGESAVAFKKDEEEIDSSPFESDCRIGIGESFNERAK